MSKKTSGSIVFILGMPRSGTTILQRIMVSSIHVNSYPETWFFASHFEKLNYETGISRIGYKVSSRGVNSFLRNNNFLSKYRESVRDTYLNITNPSNEFKYILEKTPANLLVWEDIVELKKSNDKIVVIERDLIDIYKSMLLHFDGFPFVKNLKLYKDILEYEKCLKSLKSLDNNDILYVNYDDLLENTQKVTRVINSYLELSDIVGLGELKEYKGKTLGDKNARNSSTLMKRNQKTPYLVKKISEFYFLKKISIVGILLYLMGKFVLHFNNRTINRNNKIYY
jgi:hypothetical protein